MSGGVPVPIVSSAGQYHSTPSTRACAQPQPRALQRGLQLAPPLRHGVAQPADEVRQARAGQRRVLAHDDIDQRVQPPGAVGFVRGRPHDLLRAVDPDAGVPPHDAQQPAVVHRVEQVRRRVGGSAPVVRHRPVGEMVVDLARVSLAARAHEIEDRRDPFPLRRRTTTPCRVRGCISVVHGVRHEAVVDEDVLLDAEGGVAPLQVAGSIALDAMAQREVLGAGRRPDRVGLHEAERVEGALERGAVERGCGRRRTAADRRGWVTCSKGGSATTSWTIAWQVLRVLGTTPQCTFTP